MPKKERASTRKAVKARGALPAPVVTPRRVELPWYKRRNVQAGIAFGVVFLGVLAYNVIGDLMDSRRDRRLNVRSIEQFERQLQLLNAPLEGVYQSLETTTQQFVAGELAPEEYRGQAEGWVEQFRTLYTGIRDIEIREDLEPLAEAKAHFTQGAVILLDAAKVYLQAASAAGPERETAVGLGRNLLTHGAAVLAMGERTIQEVKNEFDLNDPEVEPQAPVIPEEDAPPPAPAQPETPIVPDPAASPPASPGPTATASPAAPAATAPDPTP